MFKKILALLGLGIASCSPNKSIVNYSPYSQSEANQIYNLLFCDDPLMFKQKDDENPNYWQAILFADNIDKQAVFTIAEDTTQEARVRVIAYNLLRNEGYPVPPKKLLGIIIEVPLENGLDVLATFSDGGIRYINQTGKMAIVEGGLPETKPMVRNLFELSQKVVTTIGPWDKQRLQPPPKGNIRLTFLVSDGLYFGEGSSKVIQEDPMSGPVMNEAAILMQYVVNASLKK